jgi:hypothetical protein
MAMRYELHRVEKNTHLVDNKTGERRPSSLGIQSHHRTREGAERAKAKLVTPRKERGTGEQRAPLYDWAFAIQAHGDKNTNISWWLDWS